MPDETVIAFEQDGTRWEITKGKINCYAYRNGRKDIKAESHDGLMESAKAITKVLRSEGIRSAVLRGNGTTSTVGADKYESYFAIDSNEYGDFLRLNFKMDGKTGARIQKALRKNGVPFSWDGDEAHAFIFLVRLTPKSIEETKILFFMWNGG